MKKNILSTLIISAICFNIQAQSSGFAELDSMVGKWREVQSTFFGYPVNEESALHDFYQWYVASGMDVINLNNAGSPMTDSPSPYSSHKFEREVIEFFAPLYGYDLDDVWGIVTVSGTDGNNHGIYFGANYLYEQTGQRPVVYVSDEAHYSNLRLCHLQNLEVRLIKSDDMGRMIPQEFEKALDTSRPALVVYAMGSTFKGAIDDQQAINDIIDKYPQMSVYRHVDAALFGGYLPFTDYQKLVSRKHFKFESIAISGHKFFGLDSPSGLFLCTKKVYDNQSDFKVTYLNGNMKMISCSRDAVTPLKFWWLIKKVGYDKWASQANQMMACTQYFMKRLKDIDWPCWNNEYSNTVFFRRPDEQIVNKYNLALGYDDRFGGNLAHIVVMQHVTKDKIDLFIEDLKRSGK